MSGYLLKRVIQSLFAVWGVITLVFLILQLSGEQLSVQTPQFLCEVDEGTKLLLVHMANRFAVNSPRNPLFLQHINQLARDLASDLFLCLVRRRPEVRSADKLRMVDKRVVSGGFLQEDIRRVPTYVAGIH